MDDIRNWIYGAHWRTWVGHAVFALLWVGAAEGFDAVAGTNIRPTAAHMVRGYYLIDTVSDLVQHPHRDPWYDHVLDTAAPWVATYALEAVLPKEREHGDSKQGEDVGEYSYRLSHLRGDVLPLFHVSVEGECTVAEIKLTNEDTLACRMAINELVRQPLYIKSAATLRRILAVLRQEEEVIQELRIDILRKHAEKDEEGNPKEDEKHNFILGDNKSLADKEWTELLAQPARVIEVQPVEIDEIGNDAKVSTAALDVLMENGFIVEKREAEQTKPKIKKKRGRK